MKIRIAHVLKDATQTLLVAGTLGVPVVAVAQTAPSAEQGLASKSTAVAHSTEEAKPSPLTKSPRLTEMKIELAWLADPMTSACRLEARTVAGMVEVHGQVTNEAALKQALRLAYDESGVQVVSKAQLNPNLRPPDNSKPQEALHREAFAALRQAFPEQASAISVQTLADGRIVLRGTVPTYEIKLAISRHLRQATPCSCVVNQLQVLAEAHEPGAANSSRLASASPHAPERPKPQAIQPVAHVSQTETAAQPMGASAPDTENSSPAKPAGQGEPTAVAPETSATPAKPPAKPLVYQTKWRRMDPSEVALPKKGGTGASAKGSTQDNLASSQPPRTYLRIIPSAPEAAKPATPNTIAKASKPSPAAVPDAPPQPPAVAQKQPATTNGVALMNAVSKAPAPAPATLQRPQAITRTGAYVTNGVILVSDTTNEEVQPTNPALAALQTHLRQRIADVCGKPSRDVEVHARSETDLSVRVKANSTLEGEELSQRIFHLPELGPCQVSLDVLVMK